MAGIHKIIGDNRAQHRYLRRDMRSDQHDHYEEVRNHKKEDRDMKESPIPLFTLKFEAPPPSEQDIKAKVNGAEINQVYICSDLELLIHVDKTCKLERNVIANQIVSSLPCFDWKKQVVVNGLRKEHHMEKLRTVFREEGEDDVTMATMDATNAHIMDEQEDIEIKYSTSNGCRIYIRPQFSAREYLIEKALRALFPTDPASSPNSISCGRNHRNKVMYLRCGGVVLSLAMHHTNCRRCPNRVVLRGDLGEKL
uniref:Uncharacterized protein n=1 Tax=Oryza meridionalis TaxID=40149 RepID=A0A0E0EJY9_9ORYZ